jgi:hypothetical protein
MWQPIHHAVVLYPKNRIMDDQTRHELQIVTRMARDYFAKGKKTVSDQVTMLYQQNRSTEKANAETNGIVTHRMWVKQRQAGVFFCKREALGGDILQEYCISCKYSRIKPLNKS